MCMPASQIKCVYLVENFAARHLTLAKYREHISACRTLPVSEQKDQLSVFKYVPDKGQWDVPG